VDVIVTADTTATLVAKQATKDIPIVAAAFTEDPVATGLVDSLGRPGGNLTGNKDPRSRDERQATGTASGDRPRSDEDSGAVEPTGSLSCRAIT
jgi:hypothetical protein